VTKIDFDRDPLMVAQQWMAKGRKVALATVLETWGSAPCPVGSHLVIDQDGRFEGSVSGGCVEGAVIAEAVELVETGGRRVLEFGVADETAWRVGLSCGGRIKVHVERLDGGLASLNAARQARKPAIHIIGLDDDKDWELTQAEDSVGGTTGLPPALVAQAWATSKPGIIETDGRRYFVNPHHPAPEIVLIGATHTSQVLAPMAAMAGFAVRIIDPRQAFATPERFQGIDLSADWPQDALANRPLDAYCALVALTHDPKIDDGPLALALNAGCFYIGALGSRKTHAARLERLRLQGFSDQDLAHIHGPVGLSIGAEGPAEIAVSILAEIIQCRRRPEASPSRPS